jgi:hypothetical protein
MKDRPYFAWDIRATDADIREHLRDPDAALRAQWQGWLMREARFDEVWDYLTLEDVIDNWPLIRRHLGRMRSFWEFLLDGWRQLGLLPA